MMVSRDYRFSWLLKDHDRQIFITKPYFGALFAWVRLLGPSHRLRRLGTPELLYPPIYHPIHPSHFVDLVLANFESTRSSYACTTLLLVWVLLWELGRFGRPRRSFCAVSPLPPSFWVPLHAPKFPTAPSGQATFTFSSIFSSTTFCSSNLDPSGRWKTCCTHPWNFR